jgi:CRISPR system Cascade subunit CasD
MQSKLGVRATDREPSKSGVLGLIGAALGMDRDDTATLATLCSLELAVRVDRAGLLLRDYHTAGGGWFRGKNHIVFPDKDCIPSDRYYLQDASFVAALSGVDALVDRIAGAVQSPHWPLFLGRRACPPSEPPFLGVLSAGASAAIRSAPLSDRADSESLRLVVEVPAEEGGEPRYDVPISFVEGDRRYGLRYVRTEWFEPRETTSPDPSSSPTEDRRA